MDLSDVLEQIGPAAVAVAAHLTLLELVRCRRANRTIRAWAEDAIRDRGVTCVDVAAGVHTRALHWLVTKSRETHITVAAGAYMLGDESNDAHVQMVKPPEPAHEDDDAYDEWLNWDPMWRAGFGPLLLKRELTLAGERDATLTIRHHRHNQRQRGGGGR